MATWLEVPVVMRSSHATASAAATAPSTTQVLCPKTRASTEAMTTPATTPTERSIALVIDWLRLGCTTSSAAIAAKTGSASSTRSEEHTSELQSRENLVCRLLLVK